MYELMQGAWPTPKGNTYVSWWRDGTNDWNTISSCTTHDEYETRGLFLRGWALDVGGYLGSVGIPLAIDNPDLRVIIIEPVPENAKLIRDNIVLNGMQERVRVLEAVAAAPGEETGGVAYGWRAPGTPQQVNYEVHHFVGGSTLALDNPGVPHEEATVPAYSISALLSLVDAERFSFMKIDCEGCEAKFLTDLTGIALVDHIIGEWHPPYVDEAGVHALLDDTHIVETGGTGPGWFKAVRR